MIVFYSPCGYNSLESRVLHTCITEEAAMYQIDLTKPISIYFVGIGGVSMSGLAEILADAAPEMAFLRLWTRKESLLKLTGEGLCNSLPTLLENTSGVQTSSFTAPDGRYVYTLASFC